MVKKKEQKNPEKPQQGNHVNLVHAKGSLTVPKPQELRWVGGREAKGMVARREGNNSSWKGEHSSQGRGCAAPAAAWEYLLMPQECGYVMASPPRALPLPPSQPQPWEASLPMKCRQKFLLEAASACERLVMLNNRSLRRLLRCFPGYLSHPRELKGGKVLKTFSLRI